MPQGDRFGATNAIGARNCSRQAQWHAGCRAADAGATQDGVDISFTAGKAVGALTSFVANDVDAAMGDLKITIPDVKAVIDKMLLLERYVLT